MRPFRDIHPLYERLRHLRGSIIIVEGLIGAGKTSLGKAFTELLNNIGIPAKFFEEEVNEPLLELFLSDMKKYAFAFQMYMLQNRQKIYRESIEYAQNCNGVSFIDRSLLGDIAFCTMHTDSGNISPEEWRVYESTVNNACLRAPSVVLYLEVTPEVALRRINRRNRGSEGKQYTIQYLRDLDINYKVAMEESDTPTKYIDWNEDRPLDIDLMIELADLLDPK